MLKIYYSYCKLKKTRIYEYILLKIRAGNGAVVVVSIAVVDIVVCTGFVCVLILLSTKHTEFI
jgi:hypothetical protein